MSQIPVLLVPATPFYAAGLTSASDLGGIRDTGGLFTMYTSLRLEPSPVEHIFVVCEILKELAEVRAEKYCYRGRYVMN